MTNNNEKPTSQDELNLKDVILKIKEWKKYLLSKKRWLLICLFSLITALLGLFYALSKKPEYTALLTFSISRRADALASFYNLAAQYGFVLGGKGSEDLFDSNNIIELMKSRNIIEKILLSEVTINGKKQLLVNYFISTTECHKKWQKDEYFKNFYFPPQREKWTIKEDSLMKVLYTSFKEDYLNIERVDKKLNIIEVRFTSTDEVFAKYFVEKMIEIVSNFYIETKIGEIQRAIENLQYRSDSVKNALYSAEYELANFRDATHATIKAKGRLTEAKLTRDITILSIMYNELIKNLEVAKLALIQEKPIIQIIDTPILPLDNKKPSKKISIIIGGFIGFFIIVCYLLARKEFKEMMEMG